MKPEKSTSPTRNVPLLDVSRSNQVLLPEIQNAFDDIMQNGCFVGGKYCQQLEKEIAEYCETEFAIGCASGSDALLISLMAIGLQPGDEVILPSFTFFATASAITRLGGVPVFADIDPATFNLNPQLIPSLITSRTKAIIPVHLFGQCADMKRINEIASDHNLVVIEDAAQAIGARFEGCRAGSMSHIGCFSFYPTKNLGGFGDGGMMTTSDPQIAENLRLYANHGMKPRYCHQVVGINSRLDALQAAVLSIKLRELDKYSAGRVENARTYKTKFSAAGLQQKLVLPLQDDRCDHVWNQFTVRVLECSRDELRQALSDRGVGTEIYYPIPLHQQPCFRYLGYEPGDLPETDLAAKQVLSLPIFAELTPFELNHIVQNLTDLLTHPIRVAS